MQVGQPVGRYFIRRIALVGGPAGIVPRYNLAGRRDGGAGRGGAGGGRGRLTGRGAPCRIARGPGGYGGAVGWLVRLRISRAGMGGRCISPRVRGSGRRLPARRSRRSYGRSDGGRWAAGGFSLRECGGGRETGRGGGMGGGRRGGRPVFPGKIRSRQGKRPRRLISRLYSSSEMLLLFIEIL